MRRGTGAFDFEPKLMLDGPHAAGVADASPSPEDRVQQLQAAVTRAEARACDSEQLYKEGILAKVEVEERALAVSSRRSATVADTQFLVAGAKAQAAKKSCVMRNARLRRPVLDAANAAFAGGAAGRGDGGRGFPGRAKSNRRRWICSGSGSFTK